MIAADVQVRSGDVVSYIFCLDGDQETAKTGQADRAHRPADLAKENTTLKIGMCLLFRLGHPGILTSHKDYEFYLSNQILPPIERLCDPIEGTDRTRLAECLGLDPARFRTSTYTAIEEHAFSSLDSQMNDRDRFKDAELFLIRCRKCSASAQYRGLNEPEVGGVVNLWSPC